MLKLLRNKVSAFSIFLIWMFFAIPYFLFGKVPYPSTYQVNNFAPWSHYENFWGPVKNGAMPDVITQIYPWKYLTMQTYKSGQIPFWNPYNFSGNPHIGNFQTAAFSPVNILFFISSFLFAWTIIIVLQPLIAGIGMFTFLRSQNISNEGSLIGSITFMFCGFIVVWMAYGTLSMTISFLPFALFGIEKIFRNTKNILFLTLPIIFSLFSGHFQTSIYLLLFSFAFFIFKLVTTKKIKEALYVLLGFIVAFTLSVPQLLTSTHLYISSVRSGIYNQGGGIPFYYLITLFSPDFFGNPVTRNDWFGYYAEWASFVGIIPLTLSVFSLSKMKNKTILFFVGSLIVVLLFALDTPIQNFISILRIPVISTSNPSRIIVLCSFSISVLAAFGLDVLKQNLSLKIKRKYTPLVIAGFLLLIIWIFLFLGKLLPSDKILIAKRNLVFPTALLLIFSIIFIFSQLYEKNKIRVNFVIWLIVLMVAFDSLRFVKKWMPFDPKELVFPDTPIIKEIKKVIGYNRIFGNLGTEVNSYYSIPSIEGYDPLYIGRYGEFVESSEKGEYKEAQRSVVKLGRRAKYIDRVLDLLSVSIIFHPVADTNQGWAYPVWENKKRYSLIYQDNKFQLFKNNEILNRVHLFYKYRVVRDSKELIKQFYKDDFNFKNILLLEDDPKLKLNDGKGSAKITLYSPNHVIIEAESTSAALLFLSDNFYPGWIAKVNGKEAKIFRADYSFRSVSIPAGKSKIEFSYSFY